MTSLWKVAPPSGRFTEPGKQIVASRLNNWSYEKMTNGWPEVRAFLAQDGTLASGISAALEQRGWNDGCDYHNGFIDFKIGSLAMWKNLSQRLSVSSMAALVANDPETAVARIEDSARLVKLQTNSPMIICQLVRVASAAIAWNATWEVVTSGKCSEPQLARLQSAWEDMDFSTDMARAMEMERAMTLVHYDLIISSTDKCAKAMEELAEAAELGFGPRPPTSGFVLKHIHIPLWQFSWARQDELRSFNRWQAVIEFDRDARSKSWSGVSDRVTSLDQETGILAAALDDEERPKMNLYDRIRYLCSGMTFSIASNTTRKSLQIETQRRMLVAAIAIERWKLRHGKYPESLGQIVPELLSTVLSDLMDNQPLRFKRTLDGAALVYSVGDDGRDDGGDPQPNDVKTAYRKIWDGKDAIWPQPAQAKDAARVSHEK